MRKDHRLLTTILFDVLIWTLRLKPPSNLRLAFVRIILFASIILAGVTSGAQSVPSQLWHSDGLTGCNTSFSGDGQYILAWTSGSINVYSASTGSLVTWLAPHPPSGGQYSGIGSIENAHLSRDGSTIYYASSYESFPFVPSQVVAYDRIHGLSNALVTGLSGVSAMCISEDGSTLGFASGNNAYLVSTSSGGLLTQFPISMPGNTNATSSMNFANGGKWVVFDGPTVYDLTGKQVAAVSNTGYPIAVSPDEGTFYSYSSSLYALAAFNAEDLSLRWSVPMATSFAGASVSSDSSAVFVAASASGSWSIQGYSSSSGSPLSNQYSLQLFGARAGDLPSLTMSPKENIALLGPGNQNVSYAALVSLDTATGAGNSSGLLFEGNASSNAYSVSKGGTSQFVYDDHFDTGSRTTIRDAHTGLNSSILVTAGLVLSPDARYFIYPSGSNLDIYQVSTGNVVGTFHPNGDYYQGSFAWGPTSSQLYALINPYNGSSQTGYLLSFDGSTVTVKATIPSIQNIGAAGKYTGDGKHLGFLNLDGNRNLQVFDTSSGALTSTITPSLTSSGMARVDVCGNGPSLGVYEVLSGTTSQYREFNVSSTAQLVASIQSPLPGDTNNSDACSSPDGRYIIFSENAGGEWGWYRNAVHVYWASSGQKLLDWTGLPGKAGSRGCVSSDSTAYAYQSGYKVVVLALPPPPITIEVNPTSLIGGANAIGTITLPQPAPSTGLSINLSSSSVSANVPTSVTVPANSTQATFTITTSPVPTLVVAVIRAAGSSMTGTGNMTINPPSPSSLGITPTSVVGGTSATATVTLNGAAPQGGLTVSLSSSSTNASVPRTLTIAQGENLTSFSVTTAAVSALDIATITASTGQGSATGSLTINPPIPTSLTLSPTSVSGGSLSTGTVTLSTPAPMGGVAVDLSSNFSFVTVPGSVIVTGGSTQASFTVSTSPVSSTSPATITATVGGSSATATLTVTPPTLTDLSFSPASIAAGLSSTGTVTLSGKAASGGVTVGLSSVSSNVVIPSTVVVSAGSSSGTFTVQTLTVATQSRSVVTASLSGITKGATLTITGATLATISVSPSTVAGGASATGTATLTSGAPTGGVTVRLSSISKLVTVPASVQIPAGQSAATFSVKTLGVAAESTAIITGSVGSISQSCNLTILPPSLRSVAVSPMVVVGLTKATGTVTLNGVASSGGIVVSLSSSSGAAIVPSSVTITGGKSSATFSVKTLSVAVPMTATISAIYGGSSQTTNLTVNPPVIRSVTLSPASVVGGRNVTGTITLGTAAPTGGVLITLSSNNGSATVSASVAVASGKTSATFLVKTTQVTSQISASISASLRPSSKSATLVIKR